MPSKIDSIQFGWTWKEIRNQHFWIEWPCFDDNYFCIIFFLVVTELIHLNCWIQKTMTQRKNKHMKVWYDFSLNLLYGYK